MKNICTKIIYTLIIISVIFSITYEVVAADFWANAKDFIEVGVAGKSESHLATASSMDNIARTEFQKVIDFLWSLGLLTIFISTVILGIRYMLVSPNEKSDIKRAVTPYIVGVVIIFGALTIWKLVIDVLNGSL